MANPIGQPFHVGTQSTTAQGCDCIWLPIFTAGWAARPGEPCFPGELKAIQLSSACPGHATLALFFFKLTLNKQQEESSPGSDPFPVNSLSITEKRQAPELVNGLWKKKKNEIYNE